MDVPGTRTFHLSKVLNPTQPLTSMLDLAQHAFTSQIHVKKNMEYLTGSPSILKPGPDKPGPSPDLPRTIPPNCDLKKDRSPVPSKESRATKRPKPHCSAPPGAESASANRRNLRDPGGRPDEKHRRWETGRTDPVRNRFSADGDCAGVCGEGLRN